MSTKANSKKVTKKVVKSSRPSATHAVTRTLPEGLALRKEDADALRELERVAIGVKLQLADVELQILQFEQHRQTVAQSVVTAVEDLRKKLNEAAQSCGIDINDPDRKWALDMQKMQFMRAD